MKRPILALLLCSLFVLLPACSQRRPQPPDEPGVDSGSSAPPPVTTSAPAVTGTLPSDTASSVEEESGRVYIFVSDLYMGYFENGVWDAGDSAYVKDLLAQRAYYCYTQDALMAKSEKLTFCYENGLANSFVLGGEALIPYADEWDEENFSITFDLPAELAKDVETVMLDRYNSDVDFNIAFETDDHTIPLAISAVFNPLPGPGLKVEVPFSTEDIEAVAAELQRLGVPGAVPNITEVYEYDFDGDGGSERIILANTPQTEQRYPYVSQQELDGDDSGYYYMALCWNEKSDYQTIASWRFPYNFKSRGIPPAISLPGEYYTDAIERIVFSGIFDLNGDGVFELCLANRGYEGGHIFVFTLNGDGRFEKTLVGDYGM